MKNAFTTYQSDVYKCFKRIINEEEVEKVAKIKQQKPEELLNIQVVDLKREFADWELINIKGCSDPIWPDGTNMNLIHNHICYHRNEIKKLCSENNLELPEIYYKETPPEVDQNYMAVGFIVGPYGTPNREERVDITMPNQKYWTKCGRQFVKNSTAVVTGYEIDLREDGTISEAYQILKKEAREALADCVNCPFRISVKEGWPPVHKKWECRAGSKKPNHKTEWVGSLDDKNTINIHSLNHQLLEEIKEFCVSHPDLGAGYNADHMADCRRTLSICCSQNKKGTAAKRELIEKFFSADAEQSKRIVDTFCGDCELGKAGELADHVRCDFNGRLMHTKHELCPKFKGAKCDTLTDTAKRRHCGSCHTGHWFSGAYTYVSVVADDGINTIKRPCEPNTHYCNQVDSGQKIIASDKDFDPNAAPEWCPLEKNNLNNQPSVNDDQKEDKDAPPANKGNKPHCPYLSSHGEKFIDCNAPNARRLNTVKLDSEKACRNKVDGHCYGHFHKCEDYQKYYADPTTWDDWAVPEYRMDFKVCIYCCNNSGYTGLPKGYSGQEYCFCQVKQEPVERHASPCDWFNRHPDWAFENYDNCTNKEIAQSLVLVSKMPDIVDDREVKLNNYISDIRGKSQKIVLDYIKIGLTLIRINNEKLYEIKGYTNLIEFAHGELNFSKTLLYNTMALAQKFGVNTDNQYTKEGYVIDQKYKDFSLSQLTEMISIADDRLPGVTHDMTVKEIREYKQEVKIDELRNNDPKLKEIDEYFNNTGFCIGKSAFTVSYGKQIKYAGEYYKDDYGIDLQIDQDLLKGDFDVKWLAKLGGQEQKLRIGFNLSFEGGFEGCISYYESIVRSFVDTGYLDKIIMLYETFIINGYEPVSDFEPEIDSENDNTQIELFKWNSTFEKDSYSAEIMAEFVKGKFEIQIYDEDMIVNHSFEVMQIEEIFPRLVESWSKLLPIDVLYESNIKIENSLKGVSYFQQEFMLESQEFVIKTRKSGYEIEIRVDKDLNTVIVKHYKFGDNDSEQIKMDFEEFPGFIEKLTEVRQVPAPTYDGVSVNTIAGSERITIVVPDEVRANEDDSEIMVSSDKDVKAINFILTKMNNLIKLHKENKTVKIANEERDPMAAYYILKDFLIEYYEISANIK